jgi:hypothetical protein
MLELRFVLVEGEPPAPLEETVASFYLDPLFNVLFIDSFNGTLDLALEVMNCF